MGKEIRGQVISDKHRATWTSPVAKVRRQIDYIAINATYMGRRKNGKEKHALAFNHGP